MAEEHHSRIILEGDSSSYVGAAQKATRANEDLRGSSQKAAKSTDDLRGSSEKAAKANSGLGAAAKKASDPLLELSKNATRSGASMLQLGQQVFNVAKAFGPWGVAVAIAGDLLLGLVDSSNQAKKASQEHAKAQEAERKAIQDAATAIASKTYWETQNSEATRKATAIVDEKIMAAEQELAWTRGLGQATREQEIALMRLNAERLRSIPIDDAITADARREAEARRANNLAMATEIERRASLLELEQKAAGTVIRLDASRRRGGGGRAAAQRGTRENDAMFGSALGFGGFSGNVAGESEARAFGAEAGRVGAMQRAGSDTRDAAKAQEAADARLRAIEIERAATGETLSLINQEEEARRRLLQTQIDAATTGAERQQLQGEIEQVQHEARLKRIDAERAAEEKKAARKVALMDLVDRVAAGSAATASMIAKTAGASAKKQEQIAAGVAGGQAIIIGVLETVKAAAAFASFNYVQGAMHTAAAAFAYAQGGMLLAQAGGAGGSRGGGASSGGGGMSSGGTQGEPSGQTFRGSDSAIPGSPGPQSPSAAVSSSGPNRTTVVQINGDVYGTPRKEFIRSIREGLDLDRQGGRARRTGSDG